MFFSLSVESLRACVESFGLIEKSTHAIQAIVCDVVVILHTTFHACCVAILSRRHLGETSCKGHCSLV